MVSLAPGGSQEVRAAGAGWGPLPPLGESRKRSLFGLPSLVSWRDEIQVQVSASRHLPRKRPGVLGPHPGNVRVCLGPRSGREEKLDMNALKHVRAQSSSRECLSCD